MLVLGIETSCDETGVALYDDKKGLIGHQLYSQISLHQNYGGVVPELASRDHIRKLSALTQELLKEAKVTLSDISFVAYTAFPGLVGALLVGASFAKSLAYALKIPALPVHHLEGHIVAPMLETPDITYPFLVLLVSGGHTQLLLAREFGQYQLLGESLDDAVGEAFDKTAKLLGLPYPGGPHLAKLATKGNENAYHFPRPMVNRPGLDFSFSGLKTFALNTWLNSSQTENDKADIAACFEKAICETMRIKCERAIKQTGVNRIVVSGGVSANLSLRAELKALFEKHQGQAFFPSQAFCTDNGAMIAYLGYLKAKHDPIFLSLANQEITVNARAPLSSESN